MLTDLSQPADPLLFGRNIFDVADPESVRIITHAVGMLRENDVFDGDIRCHVVDQVTMWQRLVR